jgi:hypothetical protein
MSSLKERFRKMCDISTKDAFFRQLDMRETGLGGGLTDLERQAAAMAMWRVQRLYEQATAAEADVDRLQFLNTHASICGGELPPVIRGLLVRRPAAAQPAAVH